MSVQVNIDPQDVNEMLKRAVLDSVLGKQLKEMIDGAVHAIEADWLGKLRERIDLVVKNLVEDQLRRGPIHDKLMAAIRAKLTDEFIEEAASRMVGKWEQQIGRW